MAEIGKYGFQIINVVSLRYIKLKCAMCYKCVPRFIRKKVCNIRLNITIKKYTVRQRKYFDKLAETFKSVFVRNISLVGLFYFNFFKIELFEWPAFFITRFNGFFRTCGSDLHNTFHSLYLSILT